ncbi:hypothetical protein [Streptomyces sp. CB03911]|uniref:hypothetical protein n=1 Tax=Streptomyces sp. CB03911 TaxID=1804758 RepID=UPI0018FE7819|nr:hypothetical protein [Streptomyces sp. CB03911]
MIEPSTSARALAERVLGRPQRRHDPRPSWEQHADRLAGTNKKSSTLKEQK